MYRTSFKLITVALLAFLPVDAARAAAYYVEPVNGSDTNPGTIDQPWQTIQRALKHGWPIQFRQPGDIVYLRGGIYRGTSQAIDVNGEVSVVSGTKAAPITIKAYPGETPIVCDMANPTRGVIIKNLSWWVFDGITYKNCYQSVWMENCTHFVWQNCTFGEMPAGDSGYANLLFWGASQYNIVRNCTFTHWGRVTNGYNDHGVSISIGDEVSDVPMWYNLIENNRFLYAGHDHFQLNTAYNVIRGNLFVNAPWMPAPATGNVLASLGGEPQEPNPYEIGRASCRERV